MELTNGFLEFGWDKCIEIKCVEVDWNDGLRTRALGTKRDQIFQYHWNTPQGLIRNTLGYNVIWLNETICFLGKLGWKRERLLVIKTRKTRARLLRAFKRKHDWFQAKEPIKAVYLSFLQILEGPILVRFRHSVGGQSFHFRK